MADLKRMSPAEALERQALTARQGLDMLERGRALAEAYALTDALKTDDETALSPVDRFPDGELDPLQCPPPIDDLAARIAATTETFNKHNPEWWVSPDLEMDDHG